MERGGSITTHLASPDVPAVGCLEGQ